MLWKNAINVSSLICFIRRGFELIREWSSIEFLFLSTVLAPSLLASMGFFVGCHVTAFYFYVVVAVLSCFAFCVSWRRGCLYVTLVSFCALLTAFTFSYVGPDAQNYHFPMQYLLRHGWNPIFDSTIEKFKEIAGNAHLMVYHTLFLPKFSALCGSIIASSLGLFTGDGFLGYVLILCLLTTSFKFARRYWGAGKHWSAVFSIGLTFSTKITSFLAGQVDYSTYASFCIAAMMLMLYVRDRKISDLLVFFVSTCICASSKFTGILCSFVLIVMTLPLLYHRVEYWRVLICAFIVVGIVGASPLLTAWIQYGSPFYPSMTFDPHVKVVDITNDFTGNADAQSMGYFSRICYAWVSSKMTVAIIRILSGNPDFNPVFTVCGGVGGLGLWFNILLFVSVILLLFSRKNLVTLLCVIIFVSSNFAPLKYIGYSRYFPQMWAIFPLSVLNFVCTTKYMSKDSCWKGLIRKGLVYSLEFMVVGLSTLSFLRTLAFQGRMAVQERIRQELIATFSPSKPVKVCGWNYSFTNVARFKQAGIQLVESDESNIDTVMHPDSALPRYDVHPEVYENFNKQFPICNSVSALICEFKWLDVFKRWPHILRDR